MIVEFVETKKQDARGTASTLANYICKVEDGGTGKSYETVRFIGASSSMCVTSPFHSTNFDSEVNAPKYQVDCSAIIEEFEKAESKNRRVKHPYLHIVISLRENETLTSSQWHELIKDYVKKMGYTDHHWFACSHSNTINQHAHIMLCCISNTLPYKKLKDGQNYKKSALVRQELEKKYSLEHDNNPYTGDLCNKVSNPEIKTKIQVVRSVIDVVMTNPKSEQLSLPDFIDALINKGVGCHVQLQKGEVKGLSFSLGEDSFRASKMGLGYKFKDLQKKGLFYNKDAHWKSVEESNQLELKMTDLISNGFKAATMELGEPNQHYVLIPSPEVKKYPLDKSNHSYQFFKLWIPVSTHEKTKQQIESEIMQMKMIRLLLKVYFQWLYSRNKSKQEQNGVRFKNSNYGISKGINLSSEQLGNIVKVPNNFKMLKLHDCLLISKKEFLRLKSKDKRKISKPPSQFAMDISMF